MIETGLYLLRQTPKHHPFSAITSPLCTNDHASINLEIREYRQCFRICCGLNPSVEEDADQSAECQTHHAGILESFSFSGCVSGSPSDFLSCNASHCLSFFCTSTSLVSQASDVLFVKFEIFKCGQVVLLGLGLMVCCCRTVYHFEAALPLWG